MAEIIGLNGKKIEDLENLAPREDIIKDLKHLMGLAEKGTIRVFTAIAMLNDGETVFIENTPENNFMGILGAMEMQKHSLMQDIEEYDMDDSEDEDGLDESEESREEEEMSSGKTSEETDRELIKAAEKSDSKSIYIKDSADV